MMIRKNLFPSQTHSDTDACMHAANESDGAKRTTDESAAVSISMSGIVTTTFAEEMRRFSSSQKSNKSNSSTISEYLDVVGDEEEDYQIPAADADMDHVSGPVSPPAGPSLSQLPAGQSMSLPAPETAPQPESSASKETSDDSGVQPDRSANQPAKPHNPLQNVIRDQVTHTDSSDLTALFSKIAEYCKVIDDLDGVNNYAPEALRLSNNCHNVQTAGCFLQWPFQRVMSLIEHSELIRDELPETLPAPHYFTVPEHLRIKKAPAPIPPQPQQKDPKHDLIERLSDPEIEEISFIANKKKDGDLRNFLTSGNSTSKPFPQTSDLQKVTSSSSRPAASDCDDDLNSGSGFRRFGGGGKWGKRGNGSRNWNAGADWKKMRHGRDNEDDDEDEDSNSKDRNRFKKGSNSVPNQTGFVSGRELHELMQAKKNGGVSLVHTAATGAATKSFVNPVPGQQMKTATLSPGDAIPNVDDHLVQRVLNEIVVPVQNVSWDDIAGLQLEKKRIGEVVVYPLLRPDIFQGIRAPGKGLLLFGPPGTGKSMIGKCIASESKSTFFSVSSSSLTSKWIGEGEKMVRALFAVARKKQPAVIFIDEIDSLLAQRSDQDHEASIRLKTEFLMQFEGVTSSENDRLLVVAATNRPEALDEAARRRFDKRLMVGLPDDAARSEMVRKHMAGAHSNLSEEDLTEIASLTSGYSGSDMKFVCKEAAMGPIRSAIVSGNIETISPDDLRHVDINDFRAAVREVKASVAATEVQRHEEFNRQFGALGV